MSESAEKSQYEYLDESCMRWVRLAKDSLLKNALDWGFKVRRLSDGVVISKDRTTQLLKVW